MGKLVKEAVEWWHGRWVVDKTCKREVWSCCTEEHSQKGSVELLYRRAFTNRLSSGYVRNEGVFGNRALHPYSLARQPVHPNRLGWLTRTSTWNGLVGTVEAPQDHGHGCDGSQPPLP